MTESTWAARERPILSAIVDAEEAGDDPNVAAYAVPNLQRETVTRCIRRLCDDGFIEARFDYREDALQGVFVIRALPKALRELGVWPKSSTPLEEKRRRRLALMERIYARSDGNPRERIRVQAIGAELRWEQEETYDIAIYLRDEGLVSFPTMGTVAITHAGVVEIEEGIDNPNSATLHFPPISVINVFGSVIDSQLQAGVSESRQERS